MARIQITITADGMTAEAVVTAGAAAGSTEVQAALAAAGVRTGIDPAAIAELAAHLAEPTFCGRRVLATGCTPQAGSDGRVQMVILVGLVAGTPRADGSLDYHQRHRLHPLRAGDVLATLVPPTPGTPGHDVRGRELPARPGRPAPLQLGPGARLRADTAIVADRDGAAFVHGTRIDVLPLWTHDADVDLRCGDLATHGSLAIGGDVQPGHEVRADGDIEIRGAVVDATVRAGGNVDVGGGVLGPHADAQAGADLSCRHATAAQLGAGGTVTIGDQAMAARIRGHAITATTGRGQVVGGELRARHSIAVRVAGAPQGDTTVLATADLTAEQGELVRLQAELERLRRAVPAGRGQGPRGKGGKSAHRAFAALDAAEAERLRLRQRQRQLLAEASIAIHDTAWPGVVLRFGVTTLRVLEPTRATRFAWHPDQDTIIQEKLA